MKSQNSQNKIFLVPCPSIWGSGVSDVWTIFSLFCQKVPKYQMNSKSLLKVHSDTTELQKKEDHTTKNILSQDTQVKLDIY